MTAILQDLIHASACVTGLVGLCLWACAGAVALRTAMDAWRRRYGGMGQ